MLEGLRAKFTQHKDLKKLLLRTGSRDIILKDSIPGSYWGRGSDGMGTNKLGQLLMRTRAEMMGKTPTVETDKMHSEVGCIFRNTCLYMYMLSTWLYRMSSLIWYPYLS